MITTIQKSVTFYVWQCPRCHQELEGHLPPDVGELFCNNCDNMIYEESKQEAGRRFIDHYKFLFNATILAPKPDMDCWSDVDICDVEELHIRDSNGKLYRITADSNLYVNEVE